MRPLSSTLVVARRALLWSLIPCMAALTAQQAVCQEAAPPPEAAPAAAEQPAAAEARRLRFNFRFQKWADVLEWFAEQSDMSLVLDAPPPGTFNYSDEREYTPTEAIDLLNGVLLTKGYTLIRRGRMLVVADLNEGPPEALLPRVTLDELDQRGRFEFVSVMFPLGARDATAVATEVGPLLGPHGKAVPLPQTKQLLVSDTAGVMRAIDTVIKSIPEPQAPPQPKPDAPPEQPELAVYTIKNANPQTALDVLKSLFPDGKIALDAQAHQLSAFLTPSQHAAVRGVLDKMEANEPPETAPRLETYAAPANASAQWLATLAPLVPNARLTLAPEADQIVAWASPDEHAALALAIDKLSQGAPAAQARRLAVYRLRKADPASAQTMLQGLFPRARIAIDAPTRSLVAVATDDEQETIARTIAELDADAPDDAVRRIRYYTPLRKLTPAVVTTLGALAPEAQIAAEDDGRRLMVVATAADHQRLSAALDEIEQSRGAEDRPRLAVYSVTAAQRARFDAVLPNLAEELPGVKVIDNAGPGEIAIWARAEQHAVLSEMLEALKRDVPAAEQLQITAYQIKVADPAAVLSVLQALLPDVRFVLDAEARRIAAWARPADQQTIRATVDQLDADVPLESRSELRVYPVTAADPSAAITAVQPLVPKMRLSVDSRAGTIVAFGRADDHDTLADALDRMQSGTDPKREPKIVVHRVETGDPTATANLLSSTLPQARFVADPRNRTITAWASPADQERVGETLQQLADAAREADGAETMHVYALPKVGAAVAVQVLTSAFPQARLSAGADPQKLIAWAAPADHAALAHAIDKLEAEAGAAADRSLAVYPVRNEDVTALMQIIDPQVQQQSRIVRDAARGALIVWSTPAGHQAIGQAVAQFAEKVSDPALRKTEIYALRNIDPSAALGVVSPLVTGAQYVVDAPTRSLVVSGDDRAHEQVRALLAKIDQARADARTSESYAFAHADPQTMAGVVAQIAPLAQAVVDAAGRRLVVSAHPEDHLRIKAALDKLDQETAGDEELVVKSYATGRSMNENAYTVLSRLFARRPEVQVTRDATADHVIVLATAAQHETARRVVDDLQTASAATSDAQLEVYPLDNADPDAVGRALEQLWRRRGAAGEFSVDDEGRQVVVIAAEEQQQLVRQAIAQMQGQRDVIDVVPLEVVDPFSAEMAIEEMFSGRGGRRPRVEADFTRQQLVIRGTPDDVREVRELLGKMGEPGVAVADQNPTARGRTIRVIRFTHDPAEAVANVERLWPQLRRNPLRVVAPSAVAPTLRESRRLRAPATPAEAEDDEEPEKGDGAGGAEAPDAIECSAPLDDAVDTADGMNAVAAQPTEQPAAPPDSLAPVVVVAPGRDSVTIASDDAEALDQLEALLSSMSSTAGASGKEFTVFTLRNASAITVAATLDELFRGGSFGARLGRSAVIVSDERLNAIIVQANRTDLASIEELLNVLDTAEVPDSIAANKPQIVPVRNTSADAIYDVLRDVYRSQLTTGGGRRPIPVPQSVSREVAAMIQQINAASTGPLMTISVDSTTNSLVVLAPTTLTEEVASLVAALDKASLDDKARGMRIVPLRRTNVEQLESSLDMMLEEASRRSRRRRGGGGD